MRKKAYHFLKLCLAADIVLFLSWALYEVLWYRTHPELYVMNSAPWYVNLLVYGTSAGLAAMLLAAAMWSLKRRDKK